MPGELKNKVLQFKQAKLEIGKAMVAAGLKSTELMTHWSMLQSIITKLQLDLEDEDLTPKESIAYAEKINNHSAATLEEIENVLTNNGATLTDDHKKYLENFKLICDSLAVTCKNAFDFDENKSESHSMK